MNKHNCHLNNQSKYVLDLSIDIVYLKTLLMAVYSIYSNQIDIYTSQKHLPLEDISSYMY